MMNFIFLYRNWEIDKVKFGRRLKRLAYGDAPFSLIIFPEGTVWGQATMKKSRNYAEKMGIPPLKYCLLPRVTGLRFALNQLGRDINGIFDLTLGYVGAVPEREAPEDAFGLVDFVLRGKAPPITQIHLKYHLIKDVPYEDPDRFSAWLNERFREKDRLMVEFYQKGTFPGAKSAPFPIASPAAMAWIIPMTVLSTGIFWILGTHLIRYFYG